MFKLKKYKKKVGDYTLENIVQGKAVYKNYGDHGFLHQVEGSKALSHCLSGHMVPSNQQHFGYLLLLMSVPGDSPTLCLTS